METIGQILLGLAGFGYFICMILVLIKMFQNGATGIGIVCLLLLLCCGAGSLIVFIFGWIKSSQWKIQTLMLVWTGCIGLIVVGNVINPSGLTQLQSLYNTPPKRWAD